MQQAKSNFRYHVRLMGELLGNAIRDEYGSEFFNKIENIRKLSKSARSGESDKTKELINLLSSLKDSELLPVVRAFSQFLHLANITEQYHTLNPEEGSFCDQVDLLVNKLKIKGLSAEQIRDIFAKINIELVLTAHPTEITRRTLIQKYVNMTKCLDKMEHASTEQKKSQAKARLNELILQCWHTKEFRDKRPTPMDEVRWGLNSVEHSFWEAVPKFMRHIDHKLFQHTNLRLAPSTSLFKLSSWMGGDRDGNPFVTAEVTKEAILTARWVGANLYMKSLKQLIDELSMKTCSATLDKMTQNSPTPYRYILKKLYRRFEETKSICEKIHAHTPCSSSKMLMASKEVIEPLQLCYDSLCESGLESIARGPLLDLLCRAHTFGPGLLRLDVRQESERHNLAISELTNYLGIGDYSVWSEEERQKFLVNEIANKRPLIPEEWPCSKETQEIIDTCRVIAASHPENFTGYIISMAQQPSDILVVILFLKKCGTHWNIPVVPLFETLNDLNLAEQSLQKLFEISSYIEYINGKQMVMIGYSDSSKDAGQLAAAWAQYQAMESLSHLCEKNHIELTLFHGRGGTVARGGLPAYDAILSQPPGSVNYRIRVTEQGEMIRFKFGFPDIALQNLLLYTCATLEASVFPPPKPKPEWRRVMKNLAHHSFKEYRTTIRNDERFVSYFRHLTPEQELGRLLIGSRPAKRRASGGIETLRAIPWIFAWTQCRLMLPVWLGSGTALHKCIKEEGLSILQEMMNQWPFFKARIDMLQMIFLKTDSNITTYYENCLVPDDLKEIGEQFKLRLAENKSVVKQLNNNKPLMYSQPWERHAIKLRNPYCDPLHMLQAVLLKRLRKKQKTSENAVIEQAMMMTIAGIAAGMRNTG